MFDKVVGLPGEREENMIQMVVAIQWDHGPAEGLALESMKGTEGGPSEDCHEVRFAKSANFVDNGVPWGE
jgi:hypothetical protein